MRHISTRGLNLIRKFEGCRLKVYICPAGKKTVGFGHLTDLPLGMEITQSQADTWLMQDVDKFEKIVNEYDGAYKWTQNEFDALVSFAYNIGSLRQLTASATRDKDTIAKKMLEYINANGKPLQGLINRRKAEHDLFIDKSENTELLTNKNTDVILLLKQAIELLS